MADELNLALTDAGEGMKLPSTNENCGTIHRWLLQARPPMPATSPTGLLGRN